MPETYGIPEPEPTAPERVNSAIAQAVAGQGIVRRIVLYAIAGLLMVTPIHELAVIPLLMLMATDTGLSQ